jgi:hypothetical protein
MVEVNYRNQCGLKISGKLHVILHGKEKVGIELPLKIPQCKLRRYRTDRPVVWSRVPNPGDSPACSKLSVTSDDLFPQYFFISECGVGEGSQKYAKVGVIFD